MAQNTSDDPIVNAVLSSQGSRFVRFVLKAAFENQQANLPSQYQAGAQALFANIVMNDILSSWNTDLTETANDAFRYANNVIDNTIPAPPAAVLALAYHARGLAKRKLNNNDPTDPSDALGDFQKAVGQAPTFARAYAQLGNQMVLNGGNREDARAYIQKAIDLGGPHPASGYFFWNMGRAFFVDQNWASAIEWLQKSVKELSTAWYNRLYLAAAQQNNSDPAGATDTLENFIADPQFGDPQQFIPPEQDNPDNDPVIAARQNLREGLLAALANLR